MTFWTSRRASRVRLHRTSGTMHFVLRSKDLGCRYWSSYIVSYSGCLPCFRMCFRMLALFPDVFPDACLGFRFGILPPAGQRSRKKHVLCLGLGILPPAGQRSQKKTIPWKTNTHIYSIYIAYIYIYIYIPQTAFAVGVLTVLVKGP